MLNKRPYSGRFVYSISFNLIQCYSINFELSLNNMELLLNFN